MDPAAGEASAQPFQFTGKGSEYFRIWIVNLALTILTLGIYSAWAKVRRLQYFYRNTSLAGNSFDFHGNPVAILKGRLIAVGLLVAYNVIGTFNIALGLLVLVAVFAALPWLIQRSMCFRLHNSSYRGLRFRFAGAMGEAYQAFLMWPILAYVTLGILAPMAHREIKLYQHNNSRFGETSFSFTGRIGQFYSIYLKMLGIFFLALLAMALVAGGIAALGSFDDDPRGKGAIMAMMVVGFLVFYLLLFLAIGPWFAARIQNLVWNHTALGPHAFQSRVRARDLFRIYVTNFIGIVLTLGLYKPFADIRLARYRLTHMALAAQGDLGEFLAAEERAISAVGEETTDVIDVDISF